MEAESPEDPVSTETQTTMASDPPSWDRNIHAEFDRLWDRIVKLEASASTFSGKQGQVNDMTSPTREELDAKIAASEARTDTKFAELLGEIKAINATLSSVQMMTAGTKSAIVATGVAVFIGMAGLVIGMLAYGGSTFYNGTVIGDMIEKVVQAHTAVSPPAKTGTP